MASPGPKPLGGKCSSCMGRISKFLVSRKLRKHSFYLLLMFLAVLTSVDFFKLIRQYLSDNRDLEMFIEFNDTMTMPNVTFCMSRDHAWSHFKREGLTAPDIDRAVEEGLKNMTDGHSFLSRHWDYRMVMDAYLVIQALNSLEREASSIGALKTINNLREEPRLATMKKGIKKWVTEIHKRNVSFVDFQQKVGQETLKRSLQRFQRLSTNENGTQIQNGVKITWISQMQLCFQPHFDQKNFLPIEDQQDQFFTLQLAHNPEGLGEMLECMTLDFHGRPSSEARFMEGKGRTRDGVDEELCIGDQHEVEVEVRSVYTSLPTSEEKETKCVAYQDGDLSEFDCRSRCRMELIREACGCTAPTLSYLAKGELGQFPLCDYSQCTIELANFSDYDSGCGDKCYPDCTQIRFHLKHWRKTAPHSEVIQVTLLWGSFEYLRLIQKVRWSFEEFFANLGGSMGVWLGLSVLSVIQFITFLLTRAHRSVRKRSTANAPEQRSDRRGSRASDSGSGSEQGTTSRNHKPSNNPLGGGMSMNPLKSGFGAKKK